MTRSSSLSPRVGTSVLVAYFSHSGNTRKLAEQLASQTGADLLEIVPEQAYPEDYDAVVGQAKREIRAGLRPALRLTLPNLEAYDQVFIGTPNWWNTMAPPVLSFVEKTPLAGKTLIPFVTHEGSGMGTCVADLKRAVPGAIVVEGRAFRGSQVGSAGKSLSTWLSGLPQTLGQR